MSAARSINSALARFGQSAAIRRATVVSGDPWNPGQHLDDYPCTLAVLKYATREIDGSLILATDQKVYVSVEALSLPALPDKPESENAPDVADKLVIDGRVLEIVNVIRRVLSGSVLAYEVQARS